ncbi:MAG TPA: dethiobiotin synthase [Acidimicrobiales bacterium]|nr:dethiobiotin synthase [Acidimicrobiales bacterium]
MRPERLVAVLGTGTEAGKTWVGAAVLGELRSRGVSVAARKPVQSFAPGDGPTDAEVLAAATGEAVADVCRPHRSYQAAMAPPMAADALGRAPFTVADLVEDLGWPEGVTVGWVETVGGPRSPIAADGDSARLAAALGPDVTVLVADAGLGVINAVRLSVSATVAPPVVVLNRYDGSDLHARNRRWLERDRFDVVVEPADLAARLTP